jgi:hypothetical protein
MGFARCHVYESGTHKSSRAIGFPPAVSLVTIFGRGHARYYFVSNREHNIRRL